MTYQPGDVGLSRGSGFVDWAIRVAEARRYGTTSREAQYNHAFLLVADDGTIVQAEARGVTVGNISAYDPADILVLRPPYPDGGGERAVAAMRAMVGSRYGYLEIACEALAFLTGTKLRFGVAGEHICSGAVSHALELAGIDMGDDAEWNSPADVLHVAIANGWAAPAR